MPINVAIFGKGAVNDRWDIRDHRLDVIGSAVVLTPTFSLRSKIQRIKNQRSSLSCGGQAFSYYAEVLTSLRDGTRLGLSAKDIYCNVYIPGLGSAARDLLKQLVNNGVATEDNVPSNRTDGSCDEPFMEDRTQSQQINVREGAFHQWFSNYVSFNGRDIDQVKQAIFTGNGAVVCVRGNNACWTTKDGVVQVPAPGTDNWGHFVYLIGYDDAKKQVEFVNSWGENWGDKGFGYLPYDYFTKGFSFGEWTLIETEKDAHSKLTTMITLLKNTLKLLKLKLGIK